MGRAVSLRLFALEVRTHYSFPLFLTTVRAGFPSPADDYIEKKLDLNELCVQHTAATYFVEVSGDSMTPAGIFDGDTLVVDRAIPARPGRIIIAALNGELLVKRLARRNGRYYLVADNTNYKPIEITGHDDFEVRGVVTKVIHSV